MAKKPKKKHAPPPMKRSPPPARMQPGPNEFDAAQEQAMRAGARQARGPMPPMDEPDMGGL